MTSDHIGLPAAVSYPAAAGNTTARVIGLDLSLTATGVADTWPLRTGVIATASYGPRVDEQRRRLCYIVREVTRVIDSGPHPAMIVIEGPSFGSQGRGTWDRAGLWWLTVDELGPHYPLAIVPPACRARYATGSGRASKGMIIEAVTKRLPDVDIGGDDNRADALILAAMGADRIGHPIVAMPETHRKALDRVAWPEQVVA